MGTGDRPQGVDAGDTPGVACGDGPKLIGNDPIW